MSGPGQKTESRAIPTPTRRVMVTDSGQLPPDYSTTPGGTLFSTTPGAPNLIHLWSKSLKPAGRK